ncbi:MAG: hypothetical protein ACE5IR_04750 [bacterium]
MKLRIASLVLLWMASSLPASPVIEKKVYDISIMSKGAGPKFYLDYACFQGFEKLTYVEFYLQVPYHELQFIKHKKKFKASYEFELKIVDQDNQVIEHKKNYDTFEVGTFTETESLQRARISLLAVTLAPGDYDLEIILLDTETRYNTQVERPFQVKNFQLSNLLISDIQFSQKIKPAEEGQPYVKCGRYIEPIAMRNFGHGTNEYFYVYFEVYNLNTKASDGTDETEHVYTTEYIFSDEAGKKIAHLKRDIPKPGPTSAHSLRFGVEKLNSGLYTLQIRILDAATGQTSATSKSFRILEIPVSVSQL